ncbi:MAG: outer membrane beta-barrel protein [Rickettsiella sp.]|nr:outer membrane beta-barrel protein [Rickettsiella sp.]
MQRTAFKVIAIVAGSLALLVTKTQAAFYETNKSLASSQWFVDIGIGKSYDYGSSNVPVPLTGSTEYMLFQTNQAAAPPFFSATIGHLWALQTNYLPFISMGLQYHYTTPIVMSGFIYEIMPNNTIDPEHSYFSRYQIKQQSCSIVTKMDLYRWQNFMPYFSLGLGASWNRINQFSTTAFDLEPTQPVEFFAAKKTSSDFTYSLGIGIDYVVNSNLWLSLGYSYDNFGKNEIGQLLMYTGIADPITPIDAFVKNANLHAHNILFSARYLFD